MRSSLPIGNSWILACSAGLCLTVLISSGLGIAALMSSGPLSNSHEKLCAAGGRLAVWSRRIPSTDEITRLKDMNLRTVLCEGGKPRTAIVIPDQDSYRTLAAEINLRIRECGGGELPVLVKSLPADILKEGHVIALGNLANNPFIERLYFQWFCFTDRWYPGEGGYELRSIHNPYGAGTNVILLGGSDEEGVGRAVRRFCALLEPSNPLSVGWIMDIRLGKNLRPPVDKATAPFLLRLFTDGLEMPLGYNEASRLGLMYYYSGDARYARSFIDTARRTNLFARADHYHAHHNALVWDVIEESPVFSDEDRLFIANQLLEHVRSKEAAGGLIEAVKDSGPLMDRHEAFLGICALCEGRYLARDYPSSEWQDALVAVDSYFQPYLSTFASGSDLSRGIYTYLEATMIYSLLTESDEIVRSGSLRSWADRCVAMCDPAGFLVPSGQYDETSYPYFTLRKAAYLLRDPGLLYVSEMRKRAAENQGVYHLGMEFDQGQAFAVDLKPEPPKESIGVHVVPLDPRESRAFDPGFPPEKSFSKISFRSGFGADDQYLLLDGIWGGPPGKPIQDANAILQFTEGGRTYIVDLDPETQNRRSSYVQHNVLSVTKDGEAPEPPRLAALEAAADLPSIGLTHTRLNPYMNGSWDRFIFWRKGSYFLVRDVFRAARPGVFSLESHWRLLGNARVEVDGFRSALGGSEFAGAPESEVVVKITAARAKLKGAPGGSRLAETRESACAVKVAANRAELKSALGGSGFSNGEEAAASLNIGDLEAPDDRLPDWSIRREEIDFSSETVSRQYAAYARPVINRLRPTAVVRLEASDSEEIAALLYTTSKDRTRSYSVANLGEGLFLISGDETAWVGFMGEGGEFRRGPLAVRADAIWVTQSTLAAHGLTRLEIDGRTVLSADIPIDTECNFARRTCCLKLSGPASVWFDLLGEKRLGPGTHLLAGVKSLEDGTMVRLRDALSLELEKFKGGLQTRTPASPQSPGNAASQARSQTQPQVQHQSHAEHKAESQSVLRAERRIETGKKPTRKMPVDDLLQSALEAPKMKEVADLLSGAIINSLIIEGKGDEAVILAGCEDGRVVRMDVSGRVQWEFRTSGSVHAVAVAELSPGRWAALAGSDDEHAYALDLAGGKPIWSHRAEVYPETRDYPWWTLDRKAKVRSLLAADFDGDGRAEIAIGTGGMQVEMLNGDGSLRWRRPVHYGLPVRLIALPNNGPKRSDLTVGPTASGFRQSPDRPLRLLAGMDFLSSQSNLFSFRPDGTLESADAFPSGRTGWDYTGISALALIETGNGKTILAIGRSGAYNDVSFYDTSSGSIQGKVSVGDSVSGIIEVPLEGKPAAVVSTEAGWVLAIKPDGRVVWAVPLPDSVIRLWAAGYTELMARGENSVVAYCRSGEFFMIDAAGKILARGKGSWPAAMLSTSR